IRSPSCHRSRCSTSSTATICSGGNGAASARKRRTSCTAPVFQRLSHSQAGGCSRRPVPLLSRSLAAEDSGIFFLLKTKRLGCAVECPIELFASCLRLAADAGGDFRPGVSAYAQVRELALLVGEQGAKLAEQFFA